MRSALSLQQTTPKLNGGALAVICQAKGTACGGAAPILAGLCTVSTASRVGWRPPGGWFAGPQILESLDPDRPDPNHLLFPFITRHARLLQQHHTLCSHTLHTPTQLLVDLSFLRDQNPALRPDRSTGSQGERSRRTRGFHAAWRCMQLPTRLHSRVRSGPRQLSPGRPGRSEPQLGVQYLRSSHVCVNSALHAPDTPSGASAARWRTH